MQKKGEIERSCAFTRSKVPVSLFVDTAAFTFFPIPIMQSGLLSSLHGDLFASDCCEEKPLDTLSPVDSVFRADDKTGLRHEKRRRVRRQIAATGGWGKFSFLGEGCERT